MADGRHGPGVVDEDAGDAVGGEVLHAGLEPVDRDQARPEPARGEGGLGALAARAHDE